MWDRVAFPGVALGSIRLRHERACWQHQAIAGKVSLNDVPDAKVTVGWTF